jgi:FkbM family methyltransferase
MHNPIKLLKKLFPSSFKREIKEKLGVPSLHWALVNLRTCGFVPLFTVDIGAYIGEWTEQFLEVYPGTKVLMMEAQKSKKPFLDKITEKYSHVSHSIGLLGAINGKVVTFYENETASHVGSASENETGLRSEYLTQTLDTFIENNVYPLPDFLKLDVQGYELEVLKGAKKCLENCEVCLLEVTFLDLHPGDPLFLEVFNFMDEKGFQTYDISHLMRRPFDQALYQADIFFVRKTSQLLKSKRWN